MHNAVKWERKTRKQEDWEVRKEHGELEEQEEVENKGEEKEKDEKCDERKINYYKV